MFKKDTHINMTKEDYNLVLKSKDNIIVNIRNELDQYKQLLLDNNFCGLDELTSFINTYKKHKCRCDCLSIENTPSYKQLKTNYDAISKKLIMKENTIDIEKERLKTEIESLKKKKYDEEQDIYDNIRDEYDKEYKEKIDGLEDAISNIKNNNKDLINKLKKDNDDLKRQMENMKKPKEKPLPTPSNSTENKNETTKNGENKFCISDFCKITEYNDVDYDVKEDMMKELLNSIKMYSDIYIKIKNMSNINEIIDWLIKNRHIKYHNEKDKNRYRVINKYKRSYDLYKEFENGLQYVYFSFSKMTRISNKYWKDWLNILKNKIEEEKLKYKTTQNGGDRKNIRIDESKKYIPKQINMNPKKSYKVNEWYKHVDYSQYKVGDTVIAEKKGFNKKITIIGNFCKKCRDPFNDKGDICYSCEKEEYSYKNGLLGSCVPAPIESDHNKCNNCCNLFIYNNRNDEYCDDCIIDDNENKLY